MKFTLEIDCDNAAFEPLPAMEISRILRKIALEMADRSVTAGRCRDINGNTVGRFALVEE